MGRELKQGGFQDQGQEDERGEGRVTRVRMEGGGETRLWLMFGDKGP